MSADVNTLVNKIIADAEKKIRTDLKNVSAKVTRDFIEKAKQTVFAYYEWQPKIYERTYNLRDNVIDDSISFKILNGSRYGGGVQFTSDNMSDYDMGSKDVVVANFMHGIHGRKSVFVESNPAMDLMSDFQNNYKKILDGYFINLGYTVK